jgi:hypothetical protein
MIIDKPMTLARICALAGIFWLLPVQAQENNGIATTILITPKAGHAEDLVKAITDYHHYVAKFEGHFEYTWNEILTGPNTGKYAARSGGHNWADFDAEYDWQKETGEYFAANVRPHMEDADNLLTEEMSDFMHWPESFDGYTHFNVEDWYVKNGQYAAFRAGLKDIVDTLNAGNFPGYFGFYSVVSGGHGGQIRFVTGHKGWCDMTDRNPSFRELMSKKLGGMEQFNAFMSEWGSTFKSGPNWTVRRMPEASDYGK